MKYTYACKKVPLNDSIKDYAEKRVEKLEKYFHRDDASAFVTFTVEKDKLCTVEITIRDGSTLLRAQTTEPDGDMRGIPATWFSLKTMRSCFYRDCRMTSKMSITTMTRRTSVSFWKNMTLCRVVASL